MQSGQDQWVEIIYIFAIFNWQLLGNPICQ